VIAVQDWRESIRGCGKGLRTLFEAFARTLEAFIESNGVAEASMLCQSVDDVVADPAARAWFDRVLAFEIGGWKQDAGVDRAKQHRIEGIERLVRQQVAERAKRRQHR
jgi:hypothetical protein